MDQQDQKPETQNTASSSFRIIKANEAENIVASSNIVDQANRTSEDIVNKANKNAVLIVENARKQAQTIIKNAQSEAQQQKENIITSEEDKARQEIAADILGFVTTLQNDVKQCDELIIDLVHQSLQKIIGQFDKKEIYTQIIRQGITELQGQLGLRLRVPLEDENLARDAVDQLNISFAGRSPIEHIEVSSNLKSGECILVSDGGLLEISLECQLQNIIDGLHQLKIKGQLDA